MEELVRRLAGRLRRNPESEDVLGHGFRAAPPAGGGAVASAERRLGFRLPRTLREVYLKVANGGFGPGYGVLGVEGGFTDDQRNTAVGLYEAFRRPDPEDPSWRWPEGFLPFCYWGCTVYSVADCTRPEAPVYFTDVGVKEPGEPMETILYFQKPSFDEWLADWLDGKDLWAEVWGDDEDEDPDEG